MAALYHRINIVQCLFLGKDLSQWNRLLSLHPQQINLKAKIVRYHDLSFSKTDDSFIVIYFKPSPVGSAHVFWHSHTNYQ